MAEKKQEEPTLLVVGQLPKQETRDFEDEGKQFTCLTLEEALAEIVVTLRELKKRI